MGIDPQAMEALVQGRHGDPFGILGMHRPADGALEVRAFLPRATGVWLVDARDGRELGPLERCHPDGVFIGSAGGTGTEPFPYRLRLELPQGGVEVEDPYRFPPLLGEVDVHLLAEGSHWEQSNRLGSHPLVLEGVAGTAFAVWAPNALRVSVVGPFNDWDGRCHPMRLRREVGVWELFLPGVGEGSPYKYEILDADGHLLPLKGDPCARACEGGPHHASLVRAAEPPPWHDGEWLTQRAARNRRDAPMAIYEVHPGSWRRHPERDNAYLTYGELADQLVPYVREMGFTHLELLPIAEHPFDGSWGYQPTNLFAPTHRFGSPEQFQEFMERCHREGIGVILDWVPGHFPADPHGLARFDGSCLYEHAHPFQGVHQDWQTLIYNFGRHEVANFLLANALYWIDRFHLDGLRVDAVASMLYLDYSRRPGEWIPNVHGGNENLEAVRFLQRLNQLVYARGDGAVTMAEESTAWPRVSRPVHLGGLGFSYKWNMGWMHDTLNYMAKDPVHRRFHHDSLTFGLLYAFSENFILPLSHDEVVHGKGSLLGKMAGDRWQKFANLRLYYTFFYAHPGKKLLFMGGEFAQEREWDHDRSLDWHLLEDPAHQGVQRLVRDLNRLYRECGALHALDCEPGGFEWIDCRDVEQSVLSWVRWGREPGQHLVVVCNFTPVARHGYRVGVPAGGWYAERLNSDAREYGGSGTGNLGGVMAQAHPWHGRSHSLVLTLPPLGGLILQPEGAATGG